MRNVRFMVGGRKLLSLSLSLSLFGFGACSKKSSDAPGAPGLAEIEVPTKVDENGVVSASVTPSGTSGASVKAGSGTAISGSSLFFPPGSLTVPVDVKLSEGLALAQPEFFTEMGLQGVNAVKTGTAIAIKFDKFVDLNGALQLRIPLPADFALTGSNDADRAVILGVVLQKDNSTRAIVLPPSLITIEDHVARFDIKGPGLYQFAVLDVAPPTVAIDLESKRVVVDVVDAKADTIPPGVFSITDVDPASSDDGKATITVKWGESSDASGAIRYSVYLATAKSCVADSKKSEIYSTGDASQEIVPAETLAVGTYYACVFASDMIGNQSPAANNGSMPFVVTKKDPAVVTVTAVSVAGVADTAVVGETVQFDAFAAYSDKTTGSVTGTATWTSSDTAVATVDAAGLVTAVAAGVVSIKAVFGGQEGVAEFTVTAPVSSDKAMTSYSVAGNVGVIVGGNIAVTVPFGTNVSALVATFVHTGAMVKVGSAVQVSGVTANNFASPVVYTVTAADASTATYIVAVTVASSSAKAITSFTLSGRSASISSGAIAVTVPYGTNRNGLVATFVHSGSSIKVGMTNQVSGTSSNDFTAPLTYTVMAADSTIATYIVTVSVALDSAKDISAFSLDGTVGTIGSGTIAVIMPNGTDVSALTATFTTSGASVKIGSAAQTSGLTENNFAAPVVYRVTAADDSFQDYTVTVTVALDSAKDISAFSLDGTVGTIGSDTIAVIMPYGTDVSALTATFTTSGASVKIGSAAQTSGLTENNFAAPVVYRVTAADDSFQDYTVTVTVALDSAKDISAFSLDGTVGTIGSDTIAVIMPNGTDVSALTATFTTSGASVKIGSAAQTSGLTENNFAAPVVYRVTAADDSFQDYTVTVTVALDSAKDISAFSLDGTVGTIGSDTIAVIMPNGTDVSALTATFTTSGASVKIGSAAQTSGLTENNFAAPVVYRVTAADDSFQDYTVTVTVALDSAKDISTFSLDGTEGTIGSDTIAVIMPYGTDVSALTATFTTSGASVKIGSAAQTSGLTENNFTAPVVYRVTAADDSFQDYTVTVTVALDSAKDISAFSLDGTVGTIGSDTIAVIMPNGTDISALTATFTTSGASVKIGSAAQTSGLTENNFAAPVVYRVTAADDSFQDYTVTVTVALDSAKDISAFSLDGTEGTIGSDTIAVIMPYGTDVSTLTATFTTSGASVKIGSAAQTSGLTENNFTAPVVYRVTAADDSFQDYTVTVTVALDSAKDISTFSLDGTEGTIGSDTIAVIMPYGTDVSALTATFTTSGASVKIGSAAQTSGLTENNFTAPVVYRVTAADDSFQDYTVTVTVALDSGKDISAFSLDGTVGTIGSGTIAVIMPNGTDVSALTATFTTSGASVKIGSAAQTSGLTENNFTAPVVYRVTAADDSFQDYTVTVTVAP